ncbi:hypothetical protein V1478_012620 [Vespula squamosa]|uniref:Uncharacterized protein n=1 Tax=Vespula squamosa TaxID=30214 RepID=A0ABD2AAR9_VESSQ
MEGELPKQEMHPICCQRDPVGRDEISRDQMNNDDDDDDNDNDDDDGDDDNYDDDEDLCLGVSAYEQSRDTNSLL